MLGFAFTLCMDVSFSVCAIPDIPVRLYFIFGYIVSRSPLLLSGIKVLQKGLERALSLFRQEDGGFVLPKATIARQGATRFSQAQHRHVYVRVVVWCVRGLLL